MPPPEVKAAVRELQESFHALDWVTALPEAFLHVSAPLRAEEWGTAAPFSITYRCVNCFHDAVIVEAHAEAGPFPPSPFLPHLSIAYFRRAGPPEQLRTALVPLRDHELGTGLVDEVLVCDVPVAKARLFEPWRVVDSIRLG